ncbi:MAG: HlyD family efflux transporter periplasmic adaptor subunit [Spirulina sp. SIO3F2]|nr:HlyD family efflux transporter periplasmic adaptor subunit [Spirulina sp. SIO3F2]
MVQQLSSPTPNHRWAWLFISLALVGMGTSSAYWFRQTQAIAETESPQTITVPRTTITALGRLEPQGELVQVHAATASQENRLLELRVEQGDTVQAGEVIAVLAARDRLTAALAQAQSEVRVAQAQLAQVQAGAKPGEIQAQEAEIARIRADRQAQIQAQQTTIASRAAEVQNARTEAERYSFLHEKGAISASERDSKQLMLTTAEQNLANARAELTRLQTTQSPELSRARATLNQIAQVRPEDVQVARAEVTRALAAQQKAAADLEQVYVRSPQAGTVLEVYSRAGEVISSEGIVELGQTEQMMAIAEVYQSDVQAVETGQSATVTSNALPEALTGTVERIGAKVQRQDVVNTDPSSNIDARVVEVYMLLDEESSAIAQNFTNLQVQVEITR